MPERVKLKIATVWRTLAVSSDKRACRLELGRDRRLTAARRSRRGSLNIKPRGCTRGGTRPFFKSEVEYSVKVVKKFACEKIEKSIQIRTRPQGDSAQWER